MRLPPRPGGVFFLPRLELYFRRSLAQPTARPPMQQPDTQKNNRHELPKGWVRVTLGEVANNFDGKRIPLSAEVRKHRKGVYPYYGATEVIDWIDDFIFDGRYLLIGEDGANLLSKSRPLAFIVEGKIWVNNHAHVLQTKSNLDIHFLCYYFNSLDLKPNVTGTAQPKLTQANLNKIEIPCPEISEQHRIVTKLDTLFARLARAEAALRTAESDLERYRQSVLKTAFAAQDAEGKMKEGWRWVKVSEIGKVQLGRQRSPKNVSKDFPTKYIRAASITENGLDLSDILEMEFSPKEFEQYKLQDGDIVLSEASGSASQVGKPAIWRNEIENCCFQNTVIRLRTFPEARPEFMLAFFKSLYVNGVFAKIAGGVGINHLSAGKFGNIEFWLPPISEQVEIVSQITHALTRAAALRAAIAQGRADCARLRQSLLREAFAGRLVPQTAGDEAAAVLLERVRAERNGTAKKKSKA